eukprot:3512690-Rhodomonas_salina.1
MRLHPHATASSRGPGVLCPEKVDACIRFRGLLAQSTLATLRSSRASVWDHTAHLYGTKGRSPMTHPRRAAVRSPDASVRSEQDEAGGDAREEGSTAVVVVIVGDTLYCANTVPPRLSLASALWRRPLCSCCLHASFLAGGAVLLSLLLSVRCSSLFRADAVLLVTCTPSPLLHSLSSLPSFPSVPSSSALSAFCSRVCWS